MINLKVEPNKFKTKVMLVLAIAFMFPMFSFASPASSEIRDAIKRGFFSESSVDGDDIYITVEKGVVTLTGEVKNLGEKKAAEKIAKEKRGVLEVRNRLKVVNTVVMRKN